MSEPDRGAAVVKRSYTSVVLAAMALVVVVVVAAAWWQVMRLRTAAELTARDELKKLSALVQMDSARKHVATVAIRENLREALPHVAKLGYLVNLDVSETDFGDDDFQHLTGLSRLKGLVISRTKVTDDGLSFIEELPIENLFLAGTAITGESLDIVGRMRTLKVIELSHTKVQDNLGALAKLDRLEWIKLTGVDLSGISDQTVDALAEMPVLRRFTAPGSGFPEKSAARLKAAKPELLLEVGPESVN